MYRDAINQYVTSDPVVYGTDDSLATTKSVESTKKKHSGSPLMLSRDGGGSKRYAVTAEANQQSCQNIGEHPICGGTNGAVCAKLAHQTILELIMPSF